MLRYHYQYQQNQQNIQKMQAHMRELSAGIAELREKMNAYGTKRQKLQIDKTINENQKKKVRELEELSLESEKIFTDN